MSRSNPNDNAPNPAVRWFEWNGEDGVVRYYDKAEKQNINLPLPFTFLLLDELASVRGWHELSKSGIYSNEVKDTRTDLFVVKAFKAGTLAEGLYKEIKDRVNNLGGRFVSNCYVGFKNGGGLEIGSLRFKGAALGAWMEFRKANRNRLYDSAIAISGSTAGKKGRITYQMPVFELKTISPESNSKAVELDKQFQSWLEGYLTRTTHDRVVPPVDDAEQEDNTPLPDDDVSDIPF
jgi:hypothetical protein